jgi:branched-chain amino acid transport system ATP-binding protein
VSGCDPILTLTGVTKHFGGLRVVEDLGFTVRRGSCTALIGPNGAGKTTVFNLITGVYPIDAGRILLDGTDISCIPSRRRIQYGVARNFQNIRLMPHLSALENVLVGQHCRNSGWRGVLQPVNLIPGNRWREEARAALADAGLAGYERATVRSLPYGVQKRIELVRALVAKPRLLLLDEPAAGLNSTESRRLVDLIRRIKAAGITIMLVEHHMDVVMPTCDRITVLNYGRKLADGTPAEIKRHPEVVKAYLGKPAEPRVRPSESMREAARAAN